MKQGSLTNEVSYKEAFLALNTDLACTVKFNSKISM